MNQMKKRFTVIAGVLLLSATFAATAFAASAKTYYHHGACQVDANGNWICDNWTDNDGDGICDYYHTHNGQGQGQGQGHRGGHCNR